MVERNLQGWPRDRPADSLEQSRLRALAAGAHA